MSCHWNNTFERWHDLESVPSSFSSFICQHSDGLCSSQHIWIIIMMEFWHTAIGVLIQYIPKNMHTVTALLCFVVVIHWLIFPYPSGLLHWHCGNLTIAPVPAKQPCRIWINTSCEFIMNDCITTTKQSTTKPCAYFLGYTVYKKYHPNPDIDIACGLFYSWLFGMPFSIAWQIYHLAVSFCFHYHIHT